MSTAFFKGQQLGPEDLNIYLDDQSDRPRNAYDISYSIHDFTLGYEVLIGVPRMIPANPSVGHYYASLIIPLDANVGPYRLRWTVQETVGSEVHQFLQEFEVIDKASLITSSVTGYEADLLRGLRTLLRDRDHDRNYHFRPPAHEETIRQQNHVFGQIWLDDELQEFLRESLDNISASPPRTPFASLDSMMMMYPEWRTLLLNGAARQAIFALTMNWIADEFDYSIGGVSLSVEKSGKYQSQMQAMTDQFDKQLELAKATVKIQRGLMKPKFGMGIRSAFGPHTGTKGGMTPRKFMGF